MEQNSNFGFMRYLMDVAKLTHAEMAHVSGMLKKCTTSFSWGERYRDGEEECDIELKEGYAITLNRLFKGQYEIIVVRKFKIIIDWCGESMILQLFSPNNEVIEDDFINPSNNYHINSSAKGWAFNRNIRYTRLDEDKLEYEFGRGQGNVQGVVVSWMDSTDVRWVLDFIFKINIHSYNKLNIHLNSSYIFVVQTDNYYQIHTTNKGQNGIESFKANNTQKVVYTYKYYAFNPLISNNIYDALEDNAVEIKIGKGPRITYLDMPLNDIITYIESVY